MIMTVKNDGTDKELFVVTGSLVTIIPPDKEIIKDKNNFTDNQKYQSSNRSEVKFAGNITLITE